MDVPSWFRQLRLWLLPPSSAISPPSHLHSTKSQLSWQSKSLYFSLFSSLLLANSYVIHLNASHLRWLPTGIFFTEGLLERIRSHSLSARNQEYLEFQRLGWLNFLTLKMFGYMEIAFHMYLCEILLEMCYIWVNVLRVFCSPRSLDTRTS